MIIFNVKRKIDKYRKKIFAKSRYVAGIILTKITNAVTLHCLGDSHTMVFQTIAERRVWWHTRFQFCIVQGATVTGLANPNSQTQAYPIFQTYLDKVNSTDHLLFCMGEVDCGFVIWYRSQKYGDSVEKQLNMALQNYSQLLNRYIEKGFKNIIVCSAPLPTILDEQDWGEVANKRREVTATLRERTDLTRSFNEKMKEHTQHSGVRYLDFENETLDLETQVVKDCFRNKNRLDHHLDPQALSEVLIPKLFEINYW